MDRQHGAQQKMLCVTMESLMPEKHFLRDLDRLVDFNFVYDKVKDLYSNTGRRSVDTVVIVKMMLLGYLYGVDSERRLEQEVQVNIAYRWFFGLDLEDTVPDHSTFSQLRRRKYNDTWFLIAVDYAPRTITAIHQSPFRQFFGNNNMIIPHLPIRKTSRNLSRDKK